MHPGHLGRCPRTQLGGEFLFDEAIRGARDVQRVTTAKMLMTAMEPMFGTCRIAATIVGNRYSATSAVMTRPANW